MDISIIIPFKDECERIEMSLNEVRSYFNSRGISYEIILVDDGSLDNATTQIIEPLLTDKRILLLKHKKNLGKGAAIATGVNASHGDYIFFTDADLSTPISEFEKLYAKRLTRLVIGTRTDEKLIKTKQPFFRIFFGKLGNLVIRYLLGLSYKDTQCGFKLFDAQLAKELFSRLIIARWGFDFEVLFKARQKGVLATEIPVIWSHKGKSKLIPIVDHVRSLYELFYFRICYFIENKR